MNQNRISLLLFAASLFCGLFQASAHKSGENYIFLEVKEDHIRGRFEFKYDDLKEKMNIDLLSGEATPEATLQASAGRMHDYVRKNFSIGPNPETTYELAFAQAELFDSEGGFAQYHFRVDLESKPDFLHFYHNLFYENDRVHRGVLVLEKGVWPSEGYEMQVAIVFSEGNKEQSLDLNNIPDLMTPLDMIWQGVLHIWIGLDHILFLLALILPVTMVMTNGQWRPAPSSKSALWALLKIITVFTIAHSFTLLLAGMDIVTLPSRFIESIIALSIVLVAVNNMIGRSQNTSLLAILFLGLFHGLGFATVMGDLPFWTDETLKLIIIVLSFNVGVELGQLAILVGVFPVLFLLRNTSLFRPIVVIGGSTILALIAGFWFIERAFNL